jgi:hypothetical protein
MSLAYSDTTNKDGIIQQLEQTLFGMDADAKISGNSTLLAQFTGLINQAVDRAFAIIFQADGRWQFDDRNHTDYPIITTNIVSGQRDYTFTTDGSSNLILEVHKVAILPSATATVYQEIEPEDIKDRTFSPYVANDTSATGTPIGYDKMANAIFLDPIPDYSATNGLKVYISREGNYFTTSDTTQMPGWAGLFHEYCVLNPAYKYAYRNNLSNAPALRDEMLMMEEAMKKYYGKRAQDERAQITPKKSLYI